MLQQWPYFQTLIDMLEMVLSKADANIALYYESHLTEDEDLKVLGNQLRQRLKDAVETLLALKDESKLLSDNEVLDQSMQVRKPYLLPLHLLQAELMKRRRDYLAERQAEHTPVDHALMVSIAELLLVYVIQAKLILLTTFLKQCISDVLLLLAKFLVFLKFSPIFHF